jgi:hypothetical protein
MDPVVVTAEQLIEREAVTLLCSGDQGRVVEVSGGDARSVTNDSADDGDFAESATVRIVRRATAVAAEFLEQHQQVSGRVRRDR